ncbi:hypothetical protein N783_01975 [Pontibacillus marinus BH030004 = DSM 16465]|uniref:Transcobalamin-like C-terminal domain-containing protein n=2 Tax=Pontibacillus TaxID=289201 RepID=A0A0A5FUP1_9BACI|nr:hypothetical protein N783_01975 [Pontibacillus marinus BH030004 = DSM 16465]
MKQMLRVLIVSLFMLGALVACGGEESPTTSNENNNEAKQEENQEVVQVTVSQNNGEKVIAEKEVEIKEGTSVMEVMKNNFDIKAASGGGFITTIEGVKAEQSEKMAWFYTVNGKEAQVGAKEYELEPGDKVVWDMHSWE